ncbi:MAG: hypothetical protein QG583_13 [Patescibacteria group bacterium]|jgi:hypothetical protein|nr:hypothetical protein [Patescibacteria group bacterium]MDQ5954086.1 hypothetical protein [Patescibacteria group bacterium]
MAHIIFLECSNKCGFFQRQGGRFPFYTKDGELEFPMVPIPPNEQKLIEGYRYEKLCRNCRKSVTVYEYNDSEESKKCPDCNGTDFIESGDICPACNEGEIFVDQSKVAMF